MSWFESWTIGNELLLAWLALMLPVGILVGLFIKWGSRK